MKLMMMVLKKENVLMRMDVKMASVTSGLMTNIIN